MTKAIREAKARSSWTNPDEAYEAAVSEFLHRILDLKESHFIGEFVPFALRVARAGMVNSLAQTVLKLTVPGVPDVYQGSELWDLSLVDPRSEEHTSELQSLMRISYAVLCLK